MRVLSGYLAAEHFEGIYVLFVIPWIVDGSFKDEGLGLELGVIEDSTKTFEANLSFSDVGMTVEARGDGALGIVGVDYFQVFESKDGVHFTDGFLQAVGGGDVVAAGRKAVTCIDAEADLDIDPLLGQFAHGAELFEFTPELGATSNGVFEQDLQRFASDSAHCFFDSFDDTTQAFFNALAFVVAGMHYEVVGADGDGSFDLSTEGGDRRSADGRLTGCEIDEVAVVNDKGIEIVLFARCLEELDIGGVGSPGAPGPGTGREYLKAVGADFVGFEGGSFERSRFRCMQTDSQTAMVDHERSIAKNA